MSLYCGSAKAKIDPMIGTTLAGYMTERYSEGIHDSLYVRVIALRLDQEIVLFISLDVICVDSKYVFNLRNKIEERFGIPKKNIIVHATHTHSGPGGIISEDTLIYRAFPDIWKPYNKELVQEQYQQTLFAVDDALNSLERCKVSYGSGSVPGIGANRICRDKDYHPELNVITFEKATGKKTILYHFACHPTIMNADNIQVSADLTSTTNRYLEQYENIDMSLFFNGPSGDVSTRFTRRESSFSEVNRMGKKLSKYVLGTMQVGKSLPVKTIESNIIRLLLTSRKLENKDVISSKLSNVKKQYHLVMEKNSKLPELRSLETAIEGLKTSLVLADKLKGDENFETEIQIINLGKVSIVSVPGEMFYETGQKIKCEFPDVLLLGNTNDYVGYIVPEQYYNDNSYEASMTLLEKGSEEKIVKKIINILGGTSHVRSE